jgi:hypothetical protein
VSRVVESHRNGPTRHTMRTVAAALARRPGLWGRAVAVLVHLAAPGWWRRRPFIPLPDDRLWAFRMETAYGRPDADPSPEDVVAYVAWCRWPARPSGKRRVTEAAGER